MSATQQPMRRDLLQALARHPERDLIVIGGGATGLGVALDAAARGLSVALVEAEDFAKGTSSRATKLVHGGVREALRERPLSDAPGLHLYGTEAPAVLSLPGAQKELAPGLTEAMLRFAVRHEYARTVEDVLARRSRQLFLDARRASSIAGRAAAILSEELGESFDAGKSLRGFAALAERYCRLPAQPGQ